MSREDEYDFLFKGRKGQKSKGEEGGDGRVNSDTNSLLDLSVSEQY